MSSWQKNLTVLLIVLLAFSSIASVLPKVAAAEFNPTYGGTTKTDEQLRIKFSEHNDSVVYLADQDWINFSVTLGSLGSNCLILGAFVCSVSYKVSWLSRPVVVFDWSYNDPADRKDDDPNSTSGFKGTISLNEAPLGEQQVTVTALGGCYPTDLRSYYIHTAESSSTLKFTVASEQPTTPSPTFSSDSDIRWQTDIPWNLTDTPAQNKWHTDILGMSRAWTKPVVVDGVIYAGATSTVRLNRYGIPTIDWVDIYAFDANDGREIWDYHVDYPSISDLAWAEGRVYFGARSGLDNCSLNALDAISGQLIWSTPCSSFRATPVAENGRVFLNSGYSLLAFDGVNGEIIWNYTTADIVVASPVVANGVLYSASYDNTLYALKTQDGRKIWSYKTENGFSGYSIVGDFVFASSGDGNIYALNAKTGAKIWSHNTTPPEFTWVNCTGHSIPLYYNRALYFTSSSEQHIHYSQSNGPDVCQRTVISSVWALDARNGSRIWNITANDCGLGTPVAVCNGIVFTQEGRSILGLNTHGTVIWNFTNADLSPNSPPTIADGFIYVGYSDGQLYALRAPSLGIEIEDQDMTIVDDDQNVSLEEDEDQNIVLLIIIVAVLALASITLLFKHRLKPPHEIMRIISL